MLTYILKSTICFTVFYFSYQLFLSKIKSFQFNRYYLITTIIASAIFPLLSLKISNNSIFYISDLIYPDQKLLYNIAVKQNPISEIHNSFNTSIVLVFIYCIVSSVFLLRFITNLIKLLRLKGVRDMYYMGHKIILLNTLTPPFTFFQKIYLSQYDYNEKKIDPELITHEIVHKRQLHSIDIILIELIQILFWFNPIVYLYESAIKTNHEYLADNHSILNFDNIQSYSKKLINYINLYKNKTLASSFNYLLTKKRLIMINKKDNLKIGYIRFFIISIISIGLFIMISCNTNNRLIFDNKIEISVPKNLKYNADSKTYTYNDLKVKISFDTIQQFNNLLPIYNFNNIMNAADTGKQLINKEITEKNGLKIGIKELSTNNTTTYMIFTEINNKLLMIECTFNKTNRDKYNNELNDILSSIKQI